jgi:hypothetical protein
LAEMARLGLNLLVGTLCLLLSVTACANEPEATPRSKAASVGVAAEPASTDVDGSPTKKRLPASSPTVTLTRIAKSTPTRITSETTLRSPTAVPDTREPRAPALAATVTSSNRETIFQTPPATSQLSELEPSQVCTGESTLIQADPHPAKMGYPTTISVPTVSEGPTILDALVDIIVIDAGDLTVESYSGTTGSWPDALTPGTRSQTGWTFELVPTGEHPGRWWILVVYRTVYGFEKQLDGSLCVNP